MVRGETTVKRLAAPRVGVAPCALTRDRSTRCGFYCWWQSQCVPGALFFLLIPCVCVRELLLGVTAAGMMVPLTVDGWLCSLFHSFPLLSLSHTKKERK
ncbi:trans-sialidase [Trypanosoma cruzi Dm28c]|uniref:Trans-sialidase n=1 Tax=Trypanosoma cruzi Dm28c TaxID=1416333 RepID=V5B4Q7_TRYCR|nr:trans-sialidase [Trypanosoma cruzi Dm28c]